MRPTTVISAGLVGLVISASAFAQEWIRVCQPGRSLHVQLPDPAQVTETTYRSEHEADLPARVYSASQGQSRYSVTVVDYNQAQRILTEKCQVRARRAPNPVWEPRR